MANDDRTPEQKEADAENLADNLAYAQMTVNNEARDIERLQAANIILLSAHSLCVAFRAGANEDSGEDLALAIDSMVVRAGMHLDRVLNDHDASGREWDDEI